MQVVQDLYQEDWWLNMLAEQNTSASASWPAFPVFGAHVKHSSTDPYGLTVDLAMLTVALATLTVDLAMLTVDLNMYGEQAIWMRQSSHNYEITAFEASIIWPASPVCGGVDLRNSKAPIRCQWLT